MFTALVEHLSLVPIGISVGLQLPVSSTLGYLVPLVSKDTCDYEHMPTHRYTVIHKFNNNKRKSLMNVCMIYIYVYIFDKGN